MNAFKQQCITLRKQDYTINEIMRITGRAKSSIYPHIYSIPLSAEKREQIKKASAEHIRRFPQERKGKSARKFIPFSRWTPELVLLVAHLSFDGEIARARCVYNNNSLSLIERVEKLMRCIYSFEPKRSKNSAGVTRTSYYNVALSNYLKQKSEELFSQVVNMPLKYQREFLRAFFDDEGCMDFRIKRNHRKIRGYQKNVNVLCLAQELLRNFNIDSRVQMPNEIEIIGKANLVKFQKEINFSPGVRINGNRKNSIWKKPLEKRDILKQAILSFKS